MTDIISSPVIQYGFAGFCVLLLSFIFWLTKQLLEVIRKNNSILAKLIETINKVDRRAVRIENSVKELNNRISNLLYS